MAFTRVVDCEHVELFVATANRVNDKVSNCLRLEFAMTGSIVWVEGVC